jgi:hypothetical protein
MLTLKPICSSCESVSGYSILNEFFVFNLREALSRNQASSLGGIKQILNRRKLSPTSYSENSTSIPSFIFTTLGKDVILTADEDVSIGVAGFEVQLADSIIIEHKRRKGNDVFINDLIL